MASQTELKLQNAEARAKMLVELLARIEDLVYVQESVSKEVLELIDDALIRPERESER